MCNEANPTKLLCSWTLMMYRANSAQFSSVPIALISVLQYEFCIKYMALFQTLHYLHTYYKTYAHTCMDLEVHMYNCCIIYVLFRVSRK